MKSQKSQLKPQVSQVSPQQSNQSPTMEAKPLVRFSDLPPRAFFVSDAVHAAFELSLNDCEFALLTENVELFKIEFENACRAMDNYVCIQNAGWYNILDSHFNGVCRKRKLYEAVANEYKLRTSVFSLLGADAERAPLATMLSNTNETGRLEAAFQKWAEGVQFYIESEMKLMRPFEDRLAPEIGVKVLANGGNDWEYLARFVLVILDNHNRMNELASFLLQLQKTLETCTIIEQGRLLPLVRKNIKTSTLDKMKTLGFTQEEPVETNPPSDPALFKAFSRMGSEVPKLPMSRAFSRRASRTPSE